MSDNIKLIDINATILSIKTELDDCRKLGRDKSISADESKYLGTQCRALEKELEQAEARKKEIQRDILLSKNGVDAISTAAYNVIKPFYEKQGDYPQHWKVGFLSKHLLLEIAKAAGIEQDAEKIILDALGKSPKWRKELTDENWNRKYRVFYPKLEMFGQ